MAVERCTECGFDGDAWTDSSALDALAELPKRWKEAISALEAAEVEVRPIPGMWSIIEYADHVREVLFGMRFDRGEVLDGIARQAEALRHRLLEISAPDWASTAVIGDDEIDPHWICRRAIHDASHHLMDVQRLRTALSEGP